MRGFFLLSREGSASDMSFPTSIAALTERPAFHHAVEIYRSITLELLGGNTHGRSCDRQFAHFLGDEEEEVDDMLGLAFETLAQHRVLGGDPDRTVSNGVCIMMQPAAISGAVAKPNSSAPRSAPTTTSLPVRMPPSTWTAIRPRNRLATRV